MDRGDDRDGQAATASNAPWRRRISASSSARFFAPAAREERAVLLERGGQIEPVAEGLGARPDDDRAHLGVGREAAEGRLALGEEGRRHGGAEEGDGGDVIGDGDGEGVGHGDLGPGSSGGGGRGLSPWYAGVHGRCGLPLAFPSDAELIARLNALPESRGPIAALP